MHVLPMGNFATHGILYFRKRHWEICNWPGCFLPEARLRIMKEKSAVDIL